VSDDKALLGLLQANWLVGTYHTREEEERDSSGEGRVFVFVRELRKHVRKVGNGAFCLH
jgi:hypothetical protein